MHHVLLGVYGVLCASLVAESHEETVHPFRVSGKGHFLERAEYHQFIFNIQTVAVNRLCLWHIHVNVVYLFHDSNFFILKALDVLDILDV